MDKEFKTTFIPKKQIAQGRPARTSKRARQTQSVVGLLAILLFVTAAVSVGAVYLYKLRLATVVNTKIESINVAEKSFEPAAVLELRKLDIRLRAATELLNKHISLADFFTKHQEKNTELEILSMGMSGDYQLAIKNGSNMVRVGSAIFGARNYIA